MYAYQVHCIQCTLNTHYSILFTLFLNFQWKGRNQGRDIPKQKTNWNSFNCLSANTADEFNRQVYQLKDLKFRDNTLDKIFIKKNTNTQNIQYILFQSRYATYIIYMYSLQITKYFRS